MGSTRIVFKRGWRDGLTKSPGVVRDLSRRAQRIVDRLNAAEPDAPYRCEVSTQGNRARVRIWSIRGGDANDILRALDSGR